MALRRGSTHIWISTRAEAFAQAGSASRVALLAHPRFGSPVVELRMRSAASVATLRHRDLGPCSGAHGLVTIAP